MNPQVFPPHLRGTVVSSAYGRLGVRITGPESRRSRVYSLRKMLPETLCSAAVVREERIEDAPGIRLVNESAFETSLEANLVDRLRARGQLLVSLVAEELGRIVGHIAFTPVSLQPEAAGVHGTGLGPMAVVPERQRGGIGSLLVREGLGRCRERSFDYVVVLGHPRYYPRFGFVPASRFGVRCNWDVPDDVFMAIELRPGALIGVTGTAKYQPEFNES